MMKKFLMMMAVLATALFAFTACDKNDDDDNGGGNNNNNESVTLSAPPYKDAAKVLNITQSNSENITQLRMMESGAFMIARHIVSQSAPATRYGSSDPFYEFGKYTYTGGKYTFDNGMTISVEQQSGQTYDITITWKNGTTIKTVGTLDTSSSVTAGVMTDNLCSRPWTIKRVIASGVFNGAKLGKEFAAPVDLAEVKAWYEEKFGTLKDQFDANTIIEGIYFDSKGLFAINYQNRLDDIGVWRWSDMKAGKLVYNWNNKTQAISLFTGNASVEFEKNPEGCKLTLAGMVNNVDLQFVFYMN